MTETEFRRTLARVLGQESYHAMLRARFGLVRITNAAAMLLFQRGSGACKSYEAAVIRKQLNALETTGKWDFKEEK